MIEEFWRFAYERQAIWHRREVLQIPRPWTKDPTLHSYWFVNVHRELDPGTQFLIKNIMRKSSILEDTVFSVLLYRVFNNVDAWKEAFGGPTARGAQFLLGMKKMRARQQRGDTIATRAWTVPPLSNYPGKDYLARVEAAVSTWSPTYLLAQDLWRATGLEQAWIMIQRFPLMGKFTAYQVALDMTYLFGNLTDDEWVYTHNNGGKFKAKGGNTGGGSGSMLEQMGTDIRTLQQLRDKVLNNQGLDWNDVAWKEKPHCSLADIEHTLCEFHKYQLLKSRPTNLRGRMGRRYRKEESNAYSLTPPGPG
jgi:hypothetical protein